MSLDSGLYALKKALILGQCIITLSLASTLHAGTLSFYGSTIEIPHEWTEITQPTPNERFFVNEDQSATLNISYYRAEALSSVNAVAQHRVVSRFDGWMAILDRAAKPEELARVKANDGRVVVYSRQFIRDNHHLEEDVVGEYYYFVSPNTGYVVSIETEMGKWQESQAVFRNLIDSFGIGGRPEPIYRKPATIAATVQTTDRFGRRVDGISQKINPETPFREPYRINTGIPDIGTPHSWVLSGNSLYIQFQKHLTSIDLLSKKSLWTFQMPGLALAPIWEYRGALYTLRATPDGDALLFALQPDSGAVIFSENLGKNISKAIGTGRSMSFIKSGRIAAFDIESRTIDRTESEADQIFLSKNTPVLAKETRLIAAPETQWELPGIPSHVVGDLPRLYVTTDTPETTTLVALSPEAEHPLWTLSLGNSPPSTPPILYANSLFLFISTPMTQHHHVLQINALTGQIQKRIALSDPVIHHIPFANGVYLQFQGKDHRYTGWLPWDTTDIQMTQHSATAPWSGTVSSTKSTWLLSQDKESVYILVIKNI